MKIKKMSLDRPYQFFLRCIILLVIIGAFIPREAFDIQMHDTYFVIAFWHAILALCFIFGITLGLYWLVKKQKLIRWMTVFHLVATAFFLLCFILFGYSSEAYLTIALYSSLTSTFQQVFVFSILLWLFSQFIFLLNLLISCFRKDYSSTK